MSKWISVKDRLPENNGRKHYVVFNPYGGSLKGMSNCGIAYYKHDRWFETSSTSGGIPPTEWCCNPTHWMELPEPPHDPHTCPTCRTPGYEAQE